MLFTQSSKVHNVIVCVSEHEAIPACLASTQIIQSAVLNPPGLMYFLSYIFEKNKCMFLCLLLNLCFAGMEQALHAWQYLPLLQWVFICFAQITVKMQMYALMFF